MDVDSDTLELIERRLSDKVEAQVRDRLFKFYRTVWAVAAVVIGFFGYNAITGLTRTAETYAQSAVRASVDSANGAASDARKQVDTIAARLEAIDAYLQRREEKMIDNESRVIASQAKVQSLSGDMDHRLQAMLDQIAETEAQLRATRERVTEGAGAGNVEELRSNLAVLAEQVGLIAASVRAIEAKASGPGPAPPSEVKPREIAAVEETLRAAAPAATPAGGTVYLQFAGVDRKVVQAIASDLAAAGYAMPGEERTEAAAGLHEVRYFFDADQARADRLAEDVNRILAQGGFRSDVTVRSFTSYKSKPREGTMELWLEPARAPAGG
jgi:nitrogen fixation/metabolism regulation signal transduction histidine kinase